MSIARYDLVRVASSRNVRTELSGGIVAYKEPSKEVPEVRHTTMGTWDGPQVILEPDA